MAASVNRFLQVSKRNMSLKTLSWLCAQRILLHKNSLLGRMGQGSRLPLLNSQIYFYSSDSDSTSARILSHSTLIVQDGIDIEELPILIKKATHHSFPFSSHSYSGDKFQEESEFDTTFRQDLHNCYSVNDIFKLLEVPSEKVQGLSASLALQRLHVLKYLNTDWNQIHSFIRSAVMRELYDTVQRDVRHLSNNTLISLVECYLAAEGFSPMCIDAVNAEIQSRLGEEMFSIEELLNLAHILKSSKDTGIKHTPFFMGGKYSSVSVVSENSSRLLSNDDSNESQIKVEQFDKYSSKINDQVREEIRIKCSEVLDNVWINLASRYQDVNQHTLPLIFQALTPDNKNLIRLLQKPLVKCWADLSVEGVGIILDNLVRLRVYNAGIMTYLGRWAYVNVHQMTPPLLLSFLNTFIHFNFLDENLVKVMERCLSLKGLMVQTDVIAMCVEYCRSCRYMSPLVLDAAASHFTQYAYSYEPLQLFVVLRVFGQLNYLPAQSSAFLKKAESCLWDHFDHLQEAHLLEILGSFTFLGIQPKNFFSRVCGNDFYTKIKSLTSHQKTVALMWLRVLKHSVLLNISQDMDKTLWWLLEGKKRYIVQFYHDNQPLAVYAVKHAIDQLLGCDYHHVLPFYGCCTIYLNKDRLPLKLSRNSNGTTQIHGHIAKKLVILLRNAEHFIVNTKQLVGAQAQRLKHLTQLGFEPIEIRTSQLFYTENGSYNGAADRMKTYLKPYINFNRFNKAVINNEISQNENSSATENLFKNKLGFSSEDSMSYEIEDVFLFLSSKSTKDGVSVEDSGLWSGHKDDGNDRNNTD